MLKGRAVDALVRDIMSTDVLTARDPKDMAYILEKLRGQSMTPHRFMFHVVLFRMYSKDSTYDVLSKHVGACQPGRQSPDWTGMTKALASLYRAPEAVWGGMFYPATLRSVRLRSGRWKKFSNVTAGGAAQPAMQANRDMHAFKMVWKALEADDTLTKYFMHRKVLATDTSKNTVLQAREAFAAWYDSFYHYMSNNTKGWWGDYPMKCILDVPCTSGLRCLRDSEPVFPDMVLSRWPVRCPAYKAGLQALLKMRYKRNALGADLKYKLLMRAHAEISRRLGAQHHCVATTLAQLCWQKRRGA